MALRPYNTVAPQTNSGYARSMIASGMGQRAPACSPIWNNTAPLASVPVSSPQCSPRGAPVNMKNVIPATGVVRQTTPAFNNIQGAAPMTARGTAPVTAQGMQTTARGSAAMATGAPMPATATRQPSPPARACQPSNFKHVREPSPRHEVTRQRSAFVLPMTVEMRGSPAQRRAVERSPSYSEFPKMQHGFDSVPVPGPNKSHCFPPILHTKDLAETGTISDSTCSPLTVPLTPQTPATSDDEMVKEILAQAEAARQRATKALETCKESLPLSKARRRRSSPSPVRQTEENPGNQIDVSPRIDDMLAGVDLVANPIETPPAINTPPRAETPPLQRVAPAFQEPSSPETSCAQLKGFEGLFGLDSLKNLKQGCSTPPWPERLAHAKVSAQTVRPHSYALRDIETEIEMLYADLQTSDQRCTKGQFKPETNNVISSSLDYQPPQFQAFDELRTSEAMDQSFLNWRADLLKGVRK
eukprot:gnl/MRDRNA2_/MRDRNA2_52477_c0_seq1.p1 gnl/MRDRNA2_/MRDRNA2_52477_c0~~gnl/MRDRNA2_/MRDRNA2_52477_c0_seq1.p1  ORF type:complete len:472 (-),score=98.43 gnl/MRDRNA2_/MRDRNA2_52477_c0_seq1:81-1496(-)